MPEGYFPHIAVGIMNRLQFGDVLDDGIIQIQESPIPKLHDGDAREHLCVGGPVVDGVLIHRPFGFQVGQTISRCSDNLSIMNKHHAAPN